MPPSAVQYMDRALVDGRIDDGRVLMRGDLDNWPFHDNAGRFEARGHIVDTVFDYNPEWPRAEHLEATATFINDGMQAEAESAEVKGNRVTGVEPRARDHRSADLRFEIVHGLFAPIGMSQDRLDEKSFLNAQGVATVAFLAANSAMLGLSRL